MTTSSRGRAGTPTYYPPSADLEFSVTEDPQIGSDRICVHVRGEVDLSNSPDLGRVLDKACATGCRWVEVDLAGVEFLAAAGLDELVRVADALSDVDGRLIVTGLCPQHRRMFDITGLSALAVGNTRSR